NGALVLDAEGRVAAGGINHPARMHVGAEASSYRQQIIDPIVVAGEGLAGVVEREVALETEDEAGPDPPIVAERDAAAGDVETHRPIGQRGRGAEWDLADVEIDKCALNEGAEPQEARALIVLCLRIAGAHSGHEEQESCRGPGKVAIYHCPSSVRGRAPN